MPEKPFEIRTGHIVAAFVAVLIAAILRWHDPEVAKTNPLPVALWMMLIGGAFWEGCVRIWRIWVTDRAP